MNFQNIIPDKQVSLFIRNIMLFEEYDEKHTHLPFFADGYPGLMYQKTQTGLMVNPHKKLMPVLFLYGQTIKPIELEISGTYQLIIFQLYPFVLKNFFNVVPKKLNDDCYDLRHLKNPDMEAFIKKLNANKNTTDKIADITSFLYQLFVEKKQNLDFKIKQAIEYILNSRGRAGIGAMTGELKINARTLERRFLNEVGVSPKQFSKIIRFQFSLEQLTLKDYTKLTDIVYENGFADQSHFIKVFKAFTGKTPLHFSKPEK